MPDDRLERYRQKRDPAHTSEPFGPAGPVDTGSQRFMVHHHLASSEHYDLRLAHGGVLLSFAVPKGPSMDPAVKRLAVHVEDHPLSYADYEGVIPEGQYGAGPTLVWDVGRWSPRGPVDLDTGRLSFTLHGYKLQGAFTLIETGPSKWLLRKKHDDYAHTDTLEPRGVLSGLTAQQLGDPVAIGQARAARLSDLGAPQQPLTASAPSAMLAETSDDPDHGDDWLVELKIDGYRLFATRRGADVRLTYRSGRDATAAWPEVVAVIAALPGGDLQVDGEVTLQDERGHPDFHRVQARGMGTDPRSASRASIAQPATYYVFDVLHLDGHDTTGLPLTTRKALLSDLIPPLGAVRLITSFDDGAALYDAVRAQNLEGIVAKRRTSPYRSGRHADWLKVPCIRTLDAVVVGWTERTSDSSDLGALVLALWTGRQFRAIGKVGTGLTGAERALLLDRLRPIECREPPITQVIAGTVHWTEPEVTVRVRFARWTDSGHLFHARYVEALDVAPRSCVDTSPAHEPPPEDAAGSNRDKVFWPKTGTTKGDLLDYYAAIAPVLLPWLADRPVTVVRYPDGIHGTSFFQKHVPDWAPAWVNSRQVPSDDGGPPVRHLLIDNRDTLLWAANLGAISLHIPATRIHAPDAPDWLVVDLDPKDAPFHDVVRIAQAIHTLCDALSVPVFCKTSGKSGLHCMVPLGGGCDSDQTRLLSTLLARLVCDRLPDIATTTRSLAGRGGRVYVDAVQNGPGKQLAATWSARESEDATVSVPLAWNEVTDSLDPAQWTMDVAVKRAHTHGDPVFGSLSQRLDLEATLEAIQQLQS